MSDQPASTSSTKPKAFKPRAGIVRKSKAEREAHAKLEAERAAARAAAAAQAAGKPTQTAKSNTTKKRESVKDNRDKTQGPGAGVFGAGTGARVGRTRSAVGGFSEVLEGQENVKPNDGSSAFAPNSGNSTQQRSGAGDFTGTGGADRGKRARPNRNGPNFESDDEPDEERRDIERIWISSDEDDETDHVSSGKGKARALSEGGRVKQSLSLRPVRAPRTIAEELDRESGKTGDKKEIMDIDEDPEPDSNQFKQDVPSSPELSKRTKPGRKVGARTKDSRFTAETVEERAERLRLNEDVEKLRNEFVVPQRTKKDEDMEQDHNNTKPEGKLFLFQFPPLVPFLVDQASLGLEKRPQNQDGEIAIKSDPDGPAEGVSGSLPTLPKTQLEGLLTANELVRLPPGRVGKLKVHKSGKVTLDWGGTDMEVRYGTEVDFLQDAVLVETPTQADEGDEKSLGDKTGTTYALGQVQKKMIVIPDWQKLYE